MIGVGLQWSFRIVPAVNLQAIRRVILHSSYRRFFMETDTRPSRLRYSKSGVLQPAIGDGRSRTARRFRRLSDEFAAEIGGPLSSIERSLVAQAVGLLIRSEQFTADIVAGEAIDSGEAIRLASESRRILVALKAKAAKAKPTGDAALKAFLANLAASDAEDVA
jgi:hypothetical protein